MVRRKRRGGKVPTVPGSTHIPRPDGLSVLGAVLGIGQLILAQSDQIVLPPWLGGTLWATSGVLIGKWIRTTPWSRTAKTATTASLGVLLLALWQATAPRALLRVQKMEFADVGTNQTTGSSHAALNIVFSNVGRWATTAETLYTSRMVPYDLAQKSLFTNLDAEMRAALVDAHGLVLQVPVGSQRFFTVYSPPLSDKELSAFKNGELALIFNGFLRYGEWWPRRETSFCGFVGRDGVIQLCARFNSEE
jgi:hypothetical protein